MAVPGPLGSTPAPGNPPTPSQPIANATQDAYNASPNGQNALSVSGLLNSELGPIAAGTATQQVGLNAQQAAARAQAGNTNAQALQQLQNTLASLGIQQTGLGQENTYQQGTQGITAQQQNLQQTGLGESQANLAAQYGLQQQQFGLQGTEAQQGYQTAEHGIQTGGAASGTLGTGTTTYANQQAAQQLQDTLKGLGIEQGQAAQSYKYGTQQNTLSGQQLGLQEQQSQLSNTYQNQQLQNALQQLGLQGTQAQQGYTNTTQNSANQLASTLGGITQQQGALQSGSGQTTDDLYNQLVQAFGV